MLITTVIDIMPLVDATARSQKRLVYSVVQGINATAKKIQEVERAHLATVFTLRTPASKQFMERNVAIIKPFASVKQGKLYADITVATKTRLLLSKFESGEQRPAFKGKLIAQPVAGSPARTSFAAPVAAQYTFKAMKLKAKNVIGGGKRYEGAGGTFTVATVGVFVRLGPVVKLIYGYARTQKLKPQLRWAVTARSTADRWLTENIRKAWFS